MFTEQQLVELIPKLKRYAIKLDNRNYEDLLQDTLEKAWTKRSTYVDNGKLKNWLLSIMHNIYCEQYGKIRALRDYSVPDKINPSQETIISINECSKLTNFDLALYKAQGYSLEEIIDKLKEEDIYDIKRTWLYETINKFHKQKEEFV